MRLTVNIILLKKQFPKKKIRILKFKNNLSFLNKVYFLNKLKKSFLYNDKAVFYTKILVPIYRKKYLLQKTLLCLKTGKYRGVNPVFNLKRQIFLDFAKFNEIPNLKKK